MIASIYQTTVQPLLHASAGVLYVQEYNYYSRIMLQIYTIMLKSSNCTINPNHDLLEITDIYSEFIGDISDCFCKFQNQR